MSTALAPVAPSLFELEQDLQALFDTSDLVSPEQEAEFQHDLSEALQRSVDKRERCAQFVRHLELQEQNCDTEIARLQERKRLFRSTKERFCRYIQTVIESLGTDDKGRYRKLEGKTATFSLRAKPASVEITDETEVPHEYKYLTVTLTVPEWLSLRESAADIETAKRLDRYSVSFSKTDIRKAIDSGQEVPGADLNIGGHTLKIT